MFHMNLNREPKRMRCIAIFITAMVALLGNSGCGSRSSNTPTHTLTRGEFTSWHLLDGIIQAERSAPVYSGISQPSALLFIAPEGSRVEAGDLVAELDGAMLEQTLAGLERDYTLARAELDTLLHAEIPGELSTAEQELDTLRYEAQRQQRIVDNTAALHQQELVSDSELESQRMLLTNLNRQIIFKEGRLENLRAIVHPAREAKAKAQLEAAERQLKALRDQAQGARMIAPFAGMVAHLPIHIDGEFRTVREGDTLYRNQKIMQIADMDSLLVQAQVPEADISQVQPGNPVLITPNAFPTLRLAGRIDSIATAASTVSGKPAWQKFFSVVIRLDETDPRLRSGMSVSAQALVYREESALLIPRAMVAWEQETPWTLVLERGDAARKSLTLGPGNASHFVVLDGVSEGDVVQSPFVAAP